MSRDGEEHRQTLFYDDPVDCGIYSLTRDHKAPDETRTVSEVHRSPEKIGTYGLFAGHGGTTAADLCARNFVPTVIGDSCLQHDPERAIQNACETLEAFVIAKSNLDKACYGTSLLFAMIKNDRLFVANVGNSRAVLFTEDGVQTITQEHDGSNAEEVERVRNAGGFFENGKVNSLIPVTRSIGDVELKNRKDITISTQKMTKDILISTPDIYCRCLSPRDNCLILATAEVWEYLSNKAVVRVIQAALKLQQSPHVAAKKVALAAIKSGAMGPLSVMVLVFPTARTSDDKPFSPSKKPNSRPSSCRRHSSNLEEQQTSLKDMKGADNVPSFVRAVETEAEPDETIQRNPITISPISSPKESRVLHPSEETRSPCLQRVKTDMVSTPFSTMDVPPTRNLTIDDVSDNYVDMSQTKIQEPQHRETSKKSADLVLGTESISSCPDNENEHTSSRQQIDMERRVATVKRMFSDRRPKSSRRAKTAVVSSTSELTGSGISGDEKPALGSPGLVESDCRDFIDTISSGPSKVRYGEDGSVHVGRFGFLKELGRNFVKKR